MLGWNTDGHAVILDDRPPEEARGAVCGEPTDGVAVPAKSLTERPLGADSCPRCHALVKRYTTDPGSAPDGFEVAPPPTPEERRLSAKERAAAVRGESVSMPEDTAGAPTPIRRSRRAPEEPPGDDLEFPGEPSTPTVDGATFVRPEPGRGRKSKRDPDLDVDRG